MDHRSICNRTMDHRSICNRTMDHRSVSVFATPNPASAKRLRHRRKRCAVSRSDVLAEHADADPFPPPVVVDLFGLTC
ncbi:MAG: hypothetical protein ACI97B_003722 [Verrucomicrobiales bacterium]|jgi:hypothetical protein